jgi:hypothetical protein
MLITPHHGQLTFSRPATGAAPTTTEVSSSIAGLAFLRPSDHTRPCPKPSDTCTQAEGHNGRPRGRWP